MGYAVTAGPAKINRKFGNLRRPNTRNSVTELSAGRLNRRIENFRRNQQSIIMKNKPSKIVILATLALLPVTPCKGDDQAEFKIGYVLGRAIVDWATDRKTSPEQLREELKLVDAGWELGERLSDANTGNTIRPQPRSHPTAPNVVLSPSGDKWTPGAGYRWLNDAEGDMRVVWAPNSRHPQYPNVIAATGEGVWRPAAGYRWRYPSLATNLEVTRS